MKRVLSWAVGLVGMVALVGGGALALWVGPGGVVRLPAHELPSGVSAVVVDRALTGYEGTTLHVRATADRGDVLVAAAHPVDLDSYLGASRVLRLGQVAASGELTGVLAGDPKVAAPPLQPALDVWRQHDAGAGEQEVEVRLDGSPLQVLVQAEPGARVTVGLGAAVTGLFGAALAVAAAGAALVLVTVLLRRRHPRALSATRHDRARDGDGDGDGVSDGDGDFHGDSDGDPVGAAGPSRTGSRAGSAVAGASVVLALSGCVALPTPVPLPDRPTKAGLTSSAAGLVLADYDRRNNAAIAAVSRRPDLRAWEHVDSGPVLASDRLDTALMAVRGTQRARVTLTHVPSATYAPTFTAYPLWAMTSATVTADPRPRQGAASSRTLMLLQRGSARSAWTQHLQVPLDATPSAPLAQGPATATSAQQSAAVATMQHVDTYLERGRAAGLVPGASLTRLRAGLVKRQPGVVAVGVACQPYLTHEEPARSLRVVRTSAGVLTMMTLQCQAAATPREGMQIGWSPDYAKALGATGQLGGLWTRTLLVTVAAESRGTRAPTVLGARADLVRVADQALR